MTSSADIVVFDLISFLLLTETSSSTGRGNGRGQGSQACGWVRGHQPGGHSYSQDLPKYITGNIHN